MGLEPFWPLSQKPKIDHLRNDAYGVFSETFASGRIVGKRDTQKLLHAQLYAGTVRAVWSSSASAPARAV